jgi:hypothetical protein
MSQKSVSLGHRFHDGGAADGSFAVIGLNTSASCAASEHVSVDRH